MPDSIGEYQIAGKHIMNDELENGPQLLTCESEVPSYREIVSSGNGSDNLNTHLITNLIETEKNNAKCLKALEKRIRMLEASRKKPQPYVMSLDSLDSQH
jgi:hypothetical protein